MAQSSTTVHVFVYVPACGHAPATKAPDTFTRVNVLSQLSAATGTSAWAVAKPAASLHSKVVLKLPAAVVQVGTCVSCIVMTCVNVALIFPQSSTTVHVLVYVPACGHAPTTNAPDTFTGVNVASQLSVATGAWACAVARPAASILSWC